MHNILISGSQNSDKASTAKKIFNEVQNISVSNLICNCQYVLFF